jgi:proteasome accessory factor A
MQIVLTMIESEHVNSNLILEDPLYAVRRWSHDPSLQACAKLTSGQELTAVDLQLLFLKEARTSADRGGFEGIVPRVHDLLTLWEDTLVKLKARDFPALMPRLDWVLKFSILQRTLTQSAGLSWSSPQIKHLDHLYSSLDPAEGLYWSVEASGGLEQPVTPLQIARLTTDPPKNTRAWTRAMILRKIDPSLDTLVDIDWDCLRIRPRGGGWWVGSQTLELSNPLHHSKTDSDEAFEQSTNLEDLLNNLGAFPTTIQSYTHKVNSRFQISDRKNW